jgi:hypothetical protein
MLKHTLQTKLSIFAFKSGEMEMNQTKSFWSERGQIATASYAVWGLLAMWSISAFWQHLDQLNPEYVMMAKIGAVAAEVILFAFTSWHIFSIKMRVRLWSLIFAFVLGAAVLVHSGAIQSMNSAKAEQNEKNAGLVENLSKLNKESTVRINPSRRAKQKERLKIAEEEAQAQADALKNAQGLIVEQSNKSERIVKDSTILSHDYLNRHMYTAMFVLSLTLFSILMAIMMFAPGKTDADYDGVADEDQYPQVQQPTMRPVQPTVRRNGYATVDENNVAGSLPHNAKVGTRATGPGGDVWFMTPQGWRQAETASPQPTIQRPSFARRIFSGQTSTPVQSPSPDSKSADWPTDDAKGKRSH